MEFLLIAAAALAVLYFYYNGRRNSDLLNRKCAAEICELVTTRKAPTVEDVATIYRSNHRDGKQANHVVSMVPALLKNAGYTTQSALSVTPLLRQAASKVPRTTLRELRPEDLKNDTLDKWEALVRYDPEISAAAEKLRPYGQKWIEELGHAFFALKEDKRYLPNIILKLANEAQEEAERDAALRWENQFRRTECGELLSEASLNILRQAEISGFVLNVKTNKTIVASEKGTQTSSYLHSNNEIERFGRIAKLI